MDRGLQMRMQGPLVQNSLAAQAEKERKEQMLLARLIPFSASFPPCLVSAWVRVVVRECRSFLGKESGMEKVNGTDGAEADRQRTWGQPVLFHACPLPATWYLPTPGLGKLVSLLGLGSG